MGVQKIPIFRSLNSILIPHAAFVGFNKQYEMNYFLECAFCCLLTLKLSVMYSISCVSSDVQAIFRMAFDSSNPLHGMSAVFQTYHFNSFLYENALSNGFEIPLESYETVFEIRG